MIQRTIGNKERFYGLLYSSLPSNIFFECFYILFAPVLIVWYIGLISFLLPHSVYEIMRTSFKEYFEKEFFTDKELLKVTKFKDDDDFVLRFFVTFLANLFLTLLGCVCYKVFVGVVPAIHDIGLVPALKILAMGCYSTIIIMAFFKFLALKKISKIPIKIKYKIKDDKFK